MNIELTEELLAKSSKERFIEKANYKHAWFLILLEDDEALNMQANAILEDVVDYPVQPYTAKAIFTIDRWAHDTPHGVVQPKKRYFQREVLIRQTTADEVVAKHGTGSVLYLGLNKNTIPSDTHGLIDRINELFDLGIEEHDIMQQLITNDSKCIIMNFSTKSLRYRGAFRVDLTTPLGM